MSSDFGYIKELLSEHELKATHPRLVVLSYMFKTESHPTAEQVHDRIHINNPSISKGTVYRVLESFTEVGLVKRVATKDGLNRYDANLEPHSHIVSLNTNEIEDYFDPELNDLINRYFEQKQIKNFKLKEIKLQINGEKIDSTKPVNIS